jgi:hypothetical protein
MTTLHTILNPYKKDMHSIQIRKTDDGYDLNGYYHCYEDVTEDVYNMFALLVTRIEELELRGELSKQAHAGREQQDNMRRILIDQLEVFRSEDGFSSGGMRWSRFYWCTSGISHQTRKDAKRNGFIHLSDTTREHLELMDDAALLETYQLIIRQKSKQM